MGFAKNVEDESKDVATVVRQRFGDPSLGEPAAEPPTEPSLAAIMSKNSTTNDVCFNVENRRLDLVCREEYTIFNNCNMKVTPKPQERPQYYFFN